MKGFLISFVLIVSSVTMNAQELPYREIREYPEKYSAGTVSARMLDGLGFRFYWATEGLRSEDLKYQITDESRTSLETIEHIYGLSKVILNALKKQSNARKNENLEFSELRKRILLNIEEASDLLRTSDDEEMAKYELIFGSGENEVRYPFWNNLNGPIADALWHTGQVVMLRRASGNPLNPNISVFTGTVRE